MHPINRLVIIIKSYDCAIMNYDTDYNSDDEYVSNSYQTNFIQIRNCVINIGNSFRYFFYGELDTSTFNSICMINRDALDQVLLLIMFDGHISNTLAYPNSIGHGCSVGGPINMRGTFPRVLHLNA